MGLARIGYKPLEWSDIDQIAPTEYDLLMRHDTVRGYVHDEMSASLGYAAMRDYSPTDST